MTASIKPIQRALISVSDKSGILPLAKFLSENDIQILSTGGTAKMLAEEGIKVTEVSDYTGFPEMMDGRIKTLHPKIHGGILARRGNDEAIMQQQDILPIDLIVVNLYPFQATIANPNASLAEAIENIDIGGPTMLRAAAKNHQDVTVVVDPFDYDEIIQQIKLSGGTALELRYQLACKTFCHTAQYDGAIANYLSKRSSPDQTPKQFSDNINFQFNKLQDMRYGENPHQSAAFYAEANPPVASLATAQQLQGKELSYNNVADTDAALECVKQFDMPACVIVKHANPCGVAIAEDIQTAYQKAYATDPTSSFGGIIAFNRELDHTTAKLIIERQFVEVIIAPSISERAKLLISEKKNVRLLACGDWTAEKSLNETFDFKKVSGGLLIQQADQGLITADELKIVTKVVPSEKQIADLLFCWKVAKCVKSNAIVYAKDLSTIGVGAGQMSRVYSAKIAGIKAADEGLTVTGSVMASDAFFPFRDGIDAAAEAGISAIIQPGGSMRDQEVIDAANEHGMAMVFTAMRHFKH